MPVDVETIVVGAGVIGLAVARTAALAGQDVVVIEQHGGIGEEVSSRNSEVIHAGLYYPPGSLKARLCVRGRGLLYDYLESRHLPHRRVGKLLVATSPIEVERLGTIRATAQANGVSDLVSLSAAQARALEPELACVAALLSPSTGIVDGHALMLALQGETEEQGGSIAFGTRVASVATTRAGHYEVETEGTQSTRVTCRQLVLACGLHGTRLADTLSFASGYQPPRTGYARGRYYALRGRSPFSRLVYPMPDGVWLGTHLTLDLAGRARFGPDMEWIEEIDYRFDPSAEARFYDEIRRYWPGLADGDLEPSTTGIRPKIYRKGEAASDFAIHDETVHGLPGLVMLFGIESPGLTACLAIGEEVVRRLAR